MLYTQAIHRVYSFASPELVIASLGSVAWEVLRHAFQVTPN